MRESLLGRDPEIESVGMPMLVAIASAIEREALQRYEALGATMDRRGEVATAAAFRVMRDDERVRIEAVERWAASLGEAIPDPGKPVWKPPPDLSNSWDEIAGSALLTPYRAFAIAVENEERAFTLYSYLATRAANAAVRREAERLAIEALRHAGLMRRWRRQAWHRERRAERNEWPPSASIAASTTALHALLESHEAGIARRQRALAARLRAVGDEESARVLERIMREPSRSYTKTAALPADDAGAALGDDPVHLLVAAQEPLEALSEALEAVLRTTEGELFEQAQAALANVVARLARIALQAARRMKPA